MLSFMPYYYLDQSPCLRKQQPLLKTISHVNTMGIPSSEREEDKKSDNPPISNMRSNTTTTKPPKLSPVGQGKEMLRLAAAFWSMDSCITTPTGYQSSVLALSAIIGPSWVILMDRKCHSSIFTAACMANAGCRKKLDHNDMS